MHVQKCRLLSWIWDLKDKSFHVIRVFVSVFYILLVLYFYLIYILCFKYIHFIIIYRGQIWNIKVQRVLTLSSLIIMWMRILTYTKSITIFKHGFLLLVVASWTWATHGIGPVTTITRRWMVKDAGPSVEYFSFNISLSHSFSYAWMINEERWRSSRKQSISDHKKTMRDLTLCVMKIYFKTRQPPVIYFRFT